MTFLAFRLVSPVVQLAIWFNNVQNRNTDGLTSLDLVPDQRIQANKGRDGKSRRGKNWEPQGSYFSLDMNYRSNRTILTKNIL